MGHCDDNPPSARAQAWSVKRGVRLPSSLPLRCAPGALPGNLMAQSWKVLIPAQLLLQVTVTLPRDESTQIKNVKRNRERALFSSLKTLKIGSNLLMTSVSSDQGHLLPPPEQWAGLFTHFSNFS